jgi:hypothetical protein
MLSKVKGKLKAAWDFDSFEQAILQSAATPKVKSESRLFLQMPADHYYFALYTQVIKKFASEKNCEIIGIWPVIFTIRLKHDVLFPIRLLYDVLNYYLTRRKWLRLYKAAGVEKIILLDRVSAGSKLASWQKAWKIWNKLGSKEDLIAVSISGIHCGDLIYDTYLRYRVQPTARVRSLAMLYYIYKAHVVLESAKKMGQQKNVLAFFSSYSTYIQHGIPARWLLQQGITVYTSGNLQQRFKKLDITDHYHTARHRDYQSRFETLDRRQERIEEGTAALERKFSGVVDKATGYMKSSAYGSGTSSSLDTSKQFDGVLFLHDFYDSPHIYSSMLFPDFYEWVLHTFELIEQNKLNILVKPHPNQVADSSNDIDRLKAQFPALQWIDPRVSNAVLLKSGIKFGISLYGTILHELAYHGITAICAGDNPHTSFGFVHYPRTVAEYDWMILNHSRLQMPADFRQQVAAFYYMHNSHQRDDFELNTDLPLVSDMFTANSELACKAVKAPLQKETAPKIATLTRD